MKKTLAHTILAAYLAFITLPVMCNETSHKHEFQLVILRQSWHELHLGYKSTEALSRLHSADLTQPLFVISSNEIESYEWATQTITLTKQATTNLIQSLPSKDANEAINKLNQLKKRMGGSNSLDMELYIKGFVVTVDQAPLYGGIFLDPMSQMAIDFPVIRAEMLDGRAVLHVLPVQVPFILYDLPNSETGRDAAVAKDGAADWRQFPEQIKSAVMSNSTSPNAKAMRKLIRDPAVREIMEKAGKIQVSSATPG